MLNCLIFTNLFPNDAEPERGIFVKQLADSLREEVDVTVVSPLPYFPRVKVLESFPEWYKFTRVPPEGRGNGYGVHYPKYLLLPKVSERIHPHLVCLSLINRMRTLSRERRIDVINAQWLYPDGVAAGWLCGLLRIPLVLTGHGCDINRDLGDPRKRNLILGAIRKARKVTVVSQPLREKLISCGVDDGKIRVIPNGIDPEVFRVTDRAEARRGKGLPPATRRILFVGQLVDVKGIPFLIRAARILRDTFEESFLVHLIGEGPRREELRRIAEEEGVGDLIRFEGQMAHREIADWMGVSDVLCLPSVREGCPNVVLEALASGLPVVASRVGGIPDLVGEASGILVEPGDPQRLAAALDAALRGTWDSHRIRESVTDKTWRAIARQYADVFREAAGRRDG